MNATKSWLRALEYTKNSTGQTLPGLFESLVKNFGDRPALLTTGNQSLSYRELYQRASQVAQFALAHGLERGKVVALLMPNQLDYVAIWLGLISIGCTVALLNTELRGNALLHCLYVAKADVLIFNNNNERMILPLDLPVQQLWNWSMIRPATEQLSTYPDFWGIDVAFPEPDDRALLIYTSGTTGLPKATNVSHRRIVEWSYWFAGMMDTQPTDRLYNCLPMYHSIGGVVAIGSMLVKGGSVFIRDRFSVRQFWDDIVDTECTIFQYIGELCRYLTLSETHPKERTHRLRLACGNGMQGTVWRMLQERFAIPNVLEFYAATEGNLSLYNCEGKVGAIGRFPPFLAHRFSVAIVRCDPETRTLLRNDQGFCIRCATDEPGEAISKIDTNRRFDGYTDAKASEQKILRNVFSAGDQWFRSGDLMRQDAGGYYYFVDRLGDTFRWKGENVSTSEVATVIGALSGVIDAVVYGVEVPGNEGRAGMAAIAIDQRFSLDALSAHLKEHLPDYAHPMFVRLCTELQSTGTFKLSKTDLVRQGYPDIDPIWHRDRQTGAYRRKYPDEITTNGSETHSS